MNIRVERSVLGGFAEGLFRAAGLEADKAGAVADVLIEADTIGHATHGLALVPLYMGALARGEMAKVGTYETVSDRGACVTWRGGLLPGAWLNREAMRLAMDRARTHGIATVVVAESHHNGALAPYLAEAARAGLICYLTCSTVSVAAVAPHGGTKPLFTPNVQGMGIPTSGEPLLIDLSATISTMNMGFQLAAEGRRFPGDWMLTAEGAPTDDPAAMGAGGTLMLLGGLDKGHKGFGMALMVEALTGGLSGRGRTVSAAQARPGLDLSLYIHVIDPDAFAGRAALIAEMDALAEACRASPPRPGTTAVRMPGDGAAAKRAQALAEGVPLSAPIVEGLRKAAAELGVQTPF